MALNGRCPIDHRSLVGNAKVCEKCSHQAREQLAEIGPMYIESGAYLTPGKGGFGSSGSERTIGVNLSALGFRAADEILPILEDWERTVRVQSLGQVELDGVERDREVEMKSDGSILVVVEPRLDEIERPILRVGTIQERVEGACAFLLVHSRWLTNYEAASDWVEDIAKIHAQGQTATRKFTEKLTRIKCPTSLEVFLTEDELGYENCGNWLILGENPLDPVECKRCNSEWTTLFLVRVALETPSEPIWMDSEAIGNLLGVSSGQVARIARVNKIKPRGKRGDQIYDLIQIKASRAKAVGDE